LEERAGEDADVEEADRELCEDLHDDVKDLDNPEELRGRRSRIRARTITMRGEKYMGIP
jgi:hypothetical protein